MRYLGHVFLLGVVLILAAGYLLGAEGEIRVVVRGDDMGSCHAANVAFIKCYKEGIMRSAELMPATPWFNEAVKMLKENPGLDVGLHLGVTSEWDNYKWGPITPVTSFVDEQGHFWPQVKNWDDPEATDAMLSPKTDMKELEAELRAQIELAISKLGDQVTHMGGHMGTSRITPEVEALHQKLADEYGLLFSTEGLGIKRAGRWGGRSSQERIDSLAKLFEELEPGTYIIVEHPGLETPEMVAMSTRQNVGRDRQAVTDAFCSEKVKEVIARRGIKLLSYGDLREEARAMKKTGRKGPRRFFSDDSFWNQPLPVNPEIDPKSDYWIGLLKTEPSGNRFGINATDFAIPVYEADEYTPTYDVKELGPIVAERRGFEPGSTRYKRTFRFSHGPGFGKDVPIPDIAQADPETDHHMAIVDWDRGLVWDMWYAEKQEDGSWASFTGMVYPVDGPGVFDRGLFDAKTGDSIHHHGPGRASGVPIIAGLIMYDEVMAGEIRHKLSYATRFNALQEFVFPATWTDGRLEGGIPEGAVIQLDPGLDLSQFDLLPGEIVIAKALQKYGMVNVDNAGGSPIYAEGLYAYPDKSWEGIVREWDGGINSIPLDHYRVLKVGETTKLGDHRRR
jgi:predicted glycoside hydrolase/deacetylase ChbG (UPF0249 family)